ncbi:8-oxo-dGTP diphosphatase [Candidatus Falkowbacteria bacterium]|nr:8-oxo-dGTP diphosphatase [Candidatus Falkowbacteria bacterium]
MKQATLCLLFRQDEILLAMKKRGFGAGKWNGPGGKVEPGEAPEVTAIRELEEEVGLKARPEDLTKVASSIFRFKGRPEWDQEVHIYALRSWTGTPGETEEMRPQWFKLEDIPYAQMWADDIHWLPPVLEGKRIRGEFHFDYEGNNIESYKIEELN